MVSDGLSFGGVIGVVAACVAVLLALLSLLRWLWTQKTRHDLKGKLHSIFRLDAELQVVAVQIDDLLARGVGFNGFAMVPVPLQEPYERLRTIALKGEDLVSEIRAVPASGATERLRADLEETADELRSATTIYMRAMWEAYRQFSGKAISRGGPGRVPLAIAGQYVGSLLEKRARVRRLLRTCALRLGDDERASSAYALWPIVGSDLIRDEKGLNREAVERAVMYETVPPW